MMVDIGIVVAFIVWSFLCFIIGLLVGLWYRDNQAINEWFEKELKELKE